MRLNDLGFYYKTIRLYKRISKKQISDICGFSLQYLSKIENEVSYFSISFTIQEKIERYFNVSPNKSALSENDFLIFDEYVKRNIFYIPGEAKQLFQKIELNCDYYYNNLLFPYYLLVKYVHCILYGNDEEEVNDLSTILTKVYFHFSDRYLFLYELYTAILLKKRNYLEEAREHLKIVTARCTDLDISAMAFYQMSMLDIRMHNKLQAYINTIKAKELFEKTNNYTRTAQCLSHLGLVCINLEEYEDAKYYCEEAISVGKRLNDDIILSVNYQNLSWISLLNNQYEFVADYVDKAIKYYGVDEALFFHNAFAYMKLGEIEKSNYWAKRGINKISPRDKFLEHDYRLCKLVLDLNSTSRKERVLQRFIEHAEKSMRYDKDVMMLIYRELINLKEEKEKFKDALHYTKKINTKQQ